MRRVLTLILLLTWTGGPWIRPLPDSAGKPACGCSMMASASPLGASGLPGCCSGHGGICSLRQQQHPGPPEAPGLWSPQMRWGLTAGLNLTVSVQVGLRAPHAAVQALHHDGPSPPTPPPRRRALA